MLKTKILTTIFFITIMVAAASPANAFSIFNKDKKTEETPVAQETPIVNETAPAIAEEPKIYNNLETKEKDSIIKQIEETQNKYYEEMKKKREEYHKERAALLEKYKQKIIKEDPEVLESYIKSCTEQSIERYMMEKGGYNMSADPRMMMGY